MSASLWRVAMQEGSSPVDEAQERGVLTLIDPNPEVHVTVAAMLPSGIKLYSHIARVENVELPEADGVVCSLMLHHIAELDRDQRSQPYVYR